MSYGIRKFWCCTFTQHTSFYLTSYVTDMNYITHRRFSVHFYQPIHWYLPRILTFLSEQRAPISTMFTCRASHNVLYKSQHSNVQVSIFVTCLNFAGTGSRLYVAFVMTWYLAFTTSGRTALAVRPVISGKFLQAFLKHFYSQEMLTTSGIRFKLHLILTLSVELQTVTTFYEENYGQNELNL